MTGVRLMMNIEIGNTAQGQSMLPTSRNSEFVAQWLEA